ncbi:kinase [Planococcus halocryophilus]|uniref:kinase n=1 Tax=Planococcus halocryophilus TaxID=1215089 RepID=UPI001F10991B|nr:kinase [Planococcus halocryophilus]MCH4825196.1 kinase [Planococcus halocryophilus]
MNNLAISSWKGVFIIKTKLIILRGNSGSGKTTIAKRLQNHFGEGTLLVSQDTVRREMLMVRDREGNISQDLIKQITEYGKGKCKFVILEGIFVKQRYKAMLEDLIHFYEGNAYIYYFDLSFENTVARHNSRPQAEEFGEDLLRFWWSPDDQLGLAEEKLLTEEMTQKDILNLICIQLAV